MCADETLHGEVMCTGIMLVLNVTPEELVLRISEAYRMIVPLFGLVALSKFVRPSLIVTDAGSPPVIVGMSEVPVMS